MKEAYITNISAFFPNKPVSNDSMEDILGMIGGKASRARKIILRSNRITNRYYVVDENGDIKYSNSQLTAEAVKKLENKNFKIDQIDALICGTTVPDQIAPNHAVMVHGEVKNPSCEVISTSGICLSGLAALKVAYMGVFGGFYEKAISTGSEISSILMRSDNFEKEYSLKVDALEQRPEIAFEKDFLRWMLSDASGAFLVENRPNTDGLSLKIEWLEMRSHANVLDVCMYAGAEKQEDGSLKGWATHSRNEILEKSLMSFKQDVKLLNDNVIDYCGIKTLQAILEKKKLKADEIDYFLPHISSFYFWDELYDKLKGIGFEIPEEKWFTNLGTKGNTGAASMYVMLEELFNSGNLKKGQKILCGTPESGRFNGSYMLLSVV